MSTSEEAEGHLGLARQDLAASGSHQQTRWPPDSGGGVRAAPRAPLATSGHGRLCPPPHILTCRPPGEPP